MRIGDEVIANTKDAEWPVTQKEIEYNHHKEQAVLLVAYPGLKLDDKDRAIVSLIEEISGGMDGLLFKRIREELALLIMWVQVSWLVIPEEVYIFMPVQTPNHYQKYNMN